MNNRTKKSTGSIPVSSEHTFQKIGDRVRRHQGLVVFLGAFAVLFIILRFFMQNLQDKESSIAQKEMFQAVRFFENEDFDKALNGTEKDRGLLCILERYPKSKDGNLAYFYVGTIYMQQGFYDLAIENLQKFSSPDYVMQARAWALIGDALSEQKKYKESARRYLGAANCNSNKAFTPLYLSKAALAYEAGGELTEALKCYQRILSEFPKTQQCVDACKNLARLGKV